MVDRKPPRASDDERTVLTSLLQFQRESFVRKVSGVTDEEARMSPVASGTSLWWLATHLVWAEQLWLVVRFAGQDVHLVELDPATPIDEVLAVYREVWRQVDTIAADADLDALCRRPDVEPVPTLRWVLAHLLEEVARHAGHADILRELIDGSTGR